MRLSKEDIIRNAMAEAGVKKADAEKVVNSVFQYIKDAVAEGNTVVVFEFGRFERRHMKKRTTAWGEAPDHFRPAFTASVSFRKYVGGKE